MQTLLLRMLDLAQKQAELILEQRMLHMQLGEHIDKMDAQHQQLYQAQRSSALVEVPPPRQTVPTVTTGDTASEPLIAVDFRMPNALKNGPIRGDR
jgi:hypothetical protein